MISGDTTSTHKKTIMISYSRRQANDIKAITDYVDNADERPFRYWLDVKHIYNGQEWWEQICKGIEEADMVVAFVSEDYINSIYCMTELEYAQKLGMPILIMVIRRLSESSWNQLSAYQNLQIPIKPQNLPANLDTEGRVHCIKEALDNLKNVRKEDVDPPKQPDPINNDDTRELLIRSRKNIRQHLQKSLEDIDLKMVSLTVWDNNQEKRYLTNYITKRQFQSFANWLQNYKKGNASQDDIFKNLSSDIVDFLSEDQTKIKVKNLVNNLQDDEPITDVPYYIAQAYCAWLDQKLSGFSCHLPKAKINYPEWIYQEYVTNHSEVFFEKKFHLNSPTQSPTQKIHFRVEITFQEIMNDNAVIPKPKENRLYLKDPNGSFYICVGNTDVTHYIYDDSNDVKLEDFIQKRNEVEVPEDVATIVEAYIYTKNDKGERVLIEPVKKYLQSL